MIRYNNSAQPRRDSFHQSNAAQIPPPPKQDFHRKDSPPPKKEGCSQKKEGHSFKNPLKFLPKEIYNPKTHKFFGKLSGEDILIIGLILMVLDSGCDDDMLLVLALLYILLSDWIDFGNILF